ncbi:hypothetical protein EYF80_014314 [Liparis tanakae]|uniref:Uncharacterized protein n=1 Tax=Liparis tanakae TaxID=230148 RepID=A0A4Z2IDW2_9TELE|nr:hypothetical protein EYF80_014314 [Liparis tanakae]
MKETVYGDEPLHANKNISRLAKLNRANDASRGEKNKHDKQPRYVKLAECVSSSRCSTCASERNDSKAFHAQAVMIWSLRYLGRIQFLAQYQLQYLPVRSQHQTYPKPTVPEEEDLDSLLIKHLRYNQEQQCGRWHLHISRYQTCDSWPAISRPRPLTVSHSMSREEEEGVEEHEQGGRGGC